MNHNIYDKLGIALIVSDIVLIGAFLYALIFGDLRHAIIIFITILASFAAIYGLVRLSDRHDKKYATPTTD